MKKESSKQPKKRPALRVGVVGFELFQQLYGRYVQMDDRFETVHIWSEELALINKGRWIPILITKAKYEAEKLHYCNN